MGIEPYMLRSGVLAVLVSAAGAQAVRTARPRATAKRSFWACRASSARVPVGCPSCAGTGYLGRTVLAEMLPLDSSALGQAILARSDVATLEAIGVGWRHGRSLGAGQRAPSKRA